jgi:hypothetical protein
MSAENKLGTRFKVVYSPEYAKQYPESEVAECEAEGAEPCYLCIDTTDGRVLGRDGGEPKDQMLIRGWRWVARELNMLDADRDTITAQRDEARAKLGELVEAWDAQQAACRDWQRGELSDEGFDIASGKWRHAADAARASVADPSARREGE